jgi:outer membrane protein TolC
LPISLDTVLRLAQDQNGKLDVAREKLHEAIVEEELAAKAWLPDLYLGTSYYRHEGGIQDFDGRLIHSSFGALFAGVELRGKLDLRDAAFQKIDAARKVWQQRGEVSKLTSETLLDASTTYVDLLATQSSVVIARDIEDKMRALAKRTAGLAQVEKGVQVELARIQSEINAQRQITRKLQEGQRGAAAKLIYLLGLDPTAELVPLEKTLAAFALVDTSVQLDELVGQAHANGPGVRELEGLLALIDESTAKSQGLGRLIPVVEVNMAEGLFGAGPGSRTDWDNRWDLCVHARWNLTEFLTARQRRHLNDVKVQQAHLSYHDLRAKLVFGVREGYEASQSATEQVRLADQQVKHALDAYRLSDERLRNNLKGASASEVLLSIRALAGAHLNRISAIRDHDKAQLRLMVLLGAAVDRAPSD